VHDLPKVGEFEIGSFCGGIERGGGGGILKICLLKKRIQGGLIDLLGSAGQCLGHTGLWSSRSRETLIAGGLLSGGQLNRGIFFGHFSPSLVRP
jgi:hypothetical protein